MKGAMSIERSQILREKPYQASEAITYEKNHVYWVLDFSKFCDRMRKCWPLTTKRLGIYPRLGALVKNGVISGRNLRYGPFFVLKGENFLLCLCPLTTGDPCWVGWAGRSACSQANAIDKKYSWGIHPWLLIPLRVCAGKNGVQVDLEVVRLF